MNHVPLTDVEKEYLKDLVNQQVTEARQNLATMVNDRTYNDSDIDEANEDLDLWRNLARKLD